MRIRICTYNIHKGLSPFNLRPILVSLKELITHTNADIVCLQEVIGEHKKFKSKFGSKFIERQFEYLSDSVWSGHSYGQNAVYSKGDHGNALLSNFEIVSSNNENISIGTRESRGLLFAKLKIKNDYILNCFTTHLNLKSFDRKKQITLIEPLIKKMTESEPEAPLILCGDFNDWQNELSPIIENNLSLTDSKNKSTSKNLKTFPSSLPLFALDRIYYRGLELIDCDVLKPKNKFLSSDHLPLIADFEV